MTQTSTEYDDKAMGVARVYADAMLELARDAGVADDLREELDGLAKLVARDPGFRDFLSNPAIDADERSASLERMFRGRTSDLLTDSLQVLNRKGRSALLPAVVAQYRDAHDHWSKHVVVQVTSAQPVSDAQRADLAAAVRRRTGFEPSFEERVDPSLIGGLVVRIGDQKIDGSVATKLAKMGEALLARASREIHSGTYVEGT
jgi:F-type H+-transporting ATPase subunit delta